MTDDDESAVLSMAEGIHDPALLAEVAASTRPADATEVNRWLKSALVGIDSTTHIPPPLVVPFEPLPMGRWSRPWMLGYQRARRVRETLGSAPEEPLDVEQMVAVAGVRQETPMGITGLAKAHDDGTVVAVASQAPVHVRRFAAARAIGRRTFDNSAGGLLLTSRDEYAAKVERAFAAELLAPAEGLQKILEGSLTDEPIKDAADRYNVSIRVIEHQLQNQLRRWGSL